MIYADTDFFLALLKPSDWLQRRARELAQEHEGDLWTSPVTIIELLLLAKRRELDPERLIVDALQIAQLQHSDAQVFLRAARYMREHRAGVFDAVHAGYCGDDEIISSDMIFDKIGLKRIALEAH